MIGIRGAIQVGENTIDGIESATVELLRTMVERNKVDPSSAIAIWITQTQDLTADHAAAGARRLGWLDVPLLGAQEITRQPNIAADRGQSRPNRHYPRPVGLLRGRGRQRR